MFSPQWTTSFNSCARNNHRRQCNGAGSTTDYSSV
ncbi:hypothetical protein M5D96_013267 [Drosophila gunungcola]|uniref:Uncharacterized protein n=1 Tax=Drosophila gunungcola TaxID=103775 RepID=A0A9P9YC53_9MUSC|nr:hypothetical protein M5D96_013267 [Drosophila gunungcola]